METRLGLRGCMLWGTAGGAALWGRPPGKGQGPRPGPAPAPEPRGPSSPALLRADPDARLRPPVALGRRERGEPPETPALPAPFDTHTPANMAAGRGRADCVRAPAAPPLRLSRPRPVSPRPRPSAQPKPQRSPASRSLGPAPPSSPGLARPRQVPSGPAPRLLASHPGPASPDPSFPDPRASTRIPTTPRRLPSPPTAPHSLCPNTLQITPKPHTRVPTTPNHHTNPGKFIPESSHTANFTQTPQISPRLRHISQLHTPSPPPTHAQSPQPELKTRFPLQCALVNITRSRRWSWTSGGCWGAGCWDRCVPFVKIH